MQEFAEQTKGEVYRNPNEEAIRQLSDIISTDENSNAVSYIPNKVALNEYIQAPLLLIFLFILIANLYEF